MAFRLAAGLWALACTCSAIALQDLSQIPLQSPPSRLRDGSLVFGQDGSIATRPGRKLHGRFLHITDMHPDPFYKVHSGTDEDSACHRSRGPAGYYGAETTDCDSPFSLINETFRWVEKNLKDQIDFIVWTGDSARHDNDVEFPRDEKGVVALNQWLVDKFTEVFWDKETMSLSVPVVPTFGNNDILPHNIFSRGPNKWTKRFLQIWKNMIPEAQRHQFVQGGWFWVEVIPNRLAVFSLNTMYFFGSNSAVDGCADKDQPGYEHFEWLRVQLEQVRRRGMKAILSGHVPPARNEGKTSWDETCWQKYALWLKQYRDVVIGSVYGHMNVEHFILQDFNDIHGRVMRGYELDMQRSERVQEEGNNTLSVASHKDYLLALRKQWSRLPNPPSSLASHSSKKKQEKSEDKFYKAIGGEYGERYAVTLVAASVVPNYFPALRIIEYNITGLDQASIASPGPPSALQDLATAWDDDDDDDDKGSSLEAFGSDVEAERRKKKKKKKPKFKVPRGPSKSSPPGPAYSPQPLSWISYRQYFANITYYNNDFLNTSSLDFETRKWNDGKHSGKKPKHPRPHPLEYEYEIEYDTAETGDIYNLGDGMTVRRFIDLATRVGNYNPKKDNRVSDIDVDEDCRDEFETEEDVIETGAVSTNDDDGDTGIEKHKKHKHKKGKKHRRRKIINKTWYHFVRRALVSAANTSELDDSFGEPTAG